MTNSTFSTNTTGRNGAGISNDGGTLTVVNSTFSANVAQRFGGGIDNIKRCDNCEQPDASLRNSILYSNRGGNCAVSDKIDNLGYNISDDATCSFGTSTGANGDDVSPLPDPKGLRRNGGPTETIALQPKSPAIAAISPAHCTVKNDQHGAQRPASGQNACDIGAFDSGF